MNIAMGLPRLNEILNATAKISTSVIEAPLDKNHSTSEQGARLVKGRIEPTKLGDIADYLEELFTPNQFAVRIALNKNTIKKLHLEVTDQQVANAIATDEKFVKELKLNSDVCREEIREFPNLIF